MAQYEDPARIDFRLLRQQLHGVYRVLDGFVHQGELMVVRGFRPVHISPLVKTVNRDAFGRQAFRDVPEGLQGEDGFIPVAGTGAVDQDDRREGAFPFRKQQGARQFSVQRGNGQRQADIFKIAGFGGFFPLLIINGGGEPCDGAVFDGQHQVRRHRREDAGNAEGPAAVDFILKGRLDFRRFAQHGQLAGDAFHAAHSVHRRLQLLRHGPYAVQFFRGIPQQNGGPLVRVRGGFHPALSLLRSRGRTGGQRHHQGQESGQQFVSFLHFRFLLFSHWLFAGVSGSHSAS